MNRKNAKDRDIEIRECANMDRRLERLADPVKFLKGYFPDSFFRPFCEDQIEAIHTVVECAKYNQDEIICAPRGDWKTETLKHLVIYLILAEITRFPVWVGATGENAAASFEHIKWRFTNEDLAADFPEVCDPILALEDSPMKAKKMTFKGEKMGMFRWEAKRLIFPEVKEVPGTGKPSPYGGVKMTYRGLDSHVRGLNILGDRPDLAPCDDLETEESARMDGQIETRESLLDKAIGGLGSGETIPRIVLGTIQNRKCLTRKKLIEWGGKRYQAVVKWPDDEQAVSLRDKYIDMRREDKESGSKSFDRSYQFYVDNQEVIEADLVMGNPYNMSSKTRKDGRPLEVSAFQRVLNAAADKKWDYVKTELQNDPDEENDVQTSGLTAKIVKSRLHGGKRHEVPEDTSNRTMGLDMGKYESHWLDVSWRQPAIGRLINNNALRSTGLGKDSEQRAIETSLLSMLQGWRDKVMAYERPPEFVLVDSGTVRANDGSAARYESVVYEFIRRVGSPFAASKGWSEGKYRSHKQESAVRSGDNWYSVRLKKQKIFLYHFNADYWKNWVHQRFLTQTYGENGINPGTLSLFEMDNEPDRKDLAEQIVSEEYREEFKKGKGKRSGWYPLRESNHYFDAMVLASVAASVLGVRMFEAEQAPPNTPRRPPKPRQQSSRFKNRPGGWIQGSQRKGIK